MFVEHDLFDRASPTSPKTCSKLEGESARHDFETKLSSCSSPKIPNQITFRNPRIQIICFTRRGEEPSVCQVPSHNQTEMVVALALFARN